MRPQYSPRLRRVPPKVHNEIRRYRLQLGLTQRELAKLACIRVETLCRIETGKHTPSVATIDRIEQALMQIGKKKKKVHS